jgi:hypothetical protein
VPSYQPVISHETVGLIWSQWIVYLHVLPQFAYIIIYYVYCVTAYTETHGTADSELTQKFANLHKKIK